MSWQGIFHRGSADSFEEHADDGPRHAGQRAAGPAAPIRKPWDAWNPGDPEDIENEPSPEDVRGLRPYASGEDEATRGRRPWSRRESEREPQRAWHRTRGEHGGAPFARGQELGLEDELPHEAGQAPGDYGRQSTSRSSGTYSGRVAWRPERTGFPDGRVAWGSGWPGRQPTREEEAARRGRFAGRGPKGYQRSDDRIREDASDRLTADPDIDASDIAIVVANGDVTLTGSVGSRDQKWLAEIVMDDVPGIREVQNNLRVRRGSAEDTRTAE